MGTRGVLAGWLSITRLPRGLVPTLAWAAAADHCRPPYLGPSQRWAVSCLHPPSHYSCLQSRVSMVALRPPPHCVSRPIYHAGSLPPPQGRRVRVWGSADGRGQGSRLKCPFCSSGSAQKKTTPAEVSILGGPPSLLPEGGWGSTLPCPHPALRPWASHCTSLGLRCCHSK